MHAFNNLYFFRLGFILSEYNEKLVICARKNVDKKLISERHGQLLAVMLLLFMKVSRVGRWRLIMSISLHQSLPLIGMIVSVIKNWYYFGNIGNMYKTVGNNSHRSHSHSLNFVL